MGAPSGNRCRRYKGWQAVRTRGVVSRGGAPSASEALSSLKRALAVVSPRRWAPRRSCRAVALTAARTLLPTSCVTRDTSGSRFRPPRPAADGLNGLKALRNTSTCRRVDATAVARDGVARAIRGTHEPGMSGRGLGLGAIVASRRFRYDSTVSLGGSHGTSPHSASRSRGSSRNSMVSCSSRVST